MRIANEFEVGQPLETVWEFFGDIPEVAGCLPGTELTEHLGEDHYGGTVAIRLGPVKLDFGGEARITARDAAMHTIRVDANGSDRKGRGQAALLLDAQLQSMPAGTKVTVSMDLRLSGPAAQYGRGLIGDITAVLLEDFAKNMGNRLGATEQGYAPQLVASSPRPAGGFAIALRAFAMALGRVWRRFLLPYRPEAV